MVFDVAGPGFSRQYHKLFCEFVKKFAKALDKSLAIYYNRRKLTMTGNQ
jgi:hypothetical protein